MTWDPLAGRWGRIVAPQAADFVCDCHVALLYPRATMPWVLAGLMRLLFAAA